VRVRVAHTFGTIWAAVLLEEEGGNLVTVKCVKFLFPCGSGNGSEGIEKLK
jgi:hypothetical protein